MGAAQGLGSLRRAFAGFGTLVMHHSWLLTGDHAQALAIRSSVRDKLMQRNVVKLNVNASTLTERGLLMEEAPERRPKGVWLEGPKLGALAYALTCLLLLLLSSLLLSSLFLSSHNCLLWLALRSPTVRAPGYAGTLRHACSTATSDAAAGRAFEARPVADHGEVAAFRTGIPLEAFQPRGECRSARDADDGRLGV